MTTLVIEELTTTLSQEFSIDLNRRYQIVGIRPYVIMYNAPSGTFTVSVKEGATTLVSKDFTSAEIKADMGSSDSYAHIWKRIVFDDPLIISSGTYTINLSSSGYVFSDSSYLGWIKEHENIFNETDGLNIDYVNNPLSFQLFELKRNNYD